MVDHLPGADRTARRATSCALRARPQRKAAGKREPVWTSVRGVPVKADPALRSRGRAHAHAAGLTMPLETTASCGRPESRICQFLALGNTRRRVPGRAVSRIPSSALGGLLFTLPQPIGTHALGDSLSFLGRLLTTPVLGRGAAGRRLCRHRGRGRTGRIRRCRGFGAAAASAAAASASAAAAAAAAARARRGLAGGVLPGKPLTACWRTSISARSLSSRPPISACLLAIDVRDGLTDLLEDVVHTEERNVPSDTVSYLLVSSVRVHTKPTSWTCL